MPEKEIEDKQKGQGAFSQEVAMHELGEALAVSVVSIKRELQNYPDERGSFAVDDFEVDIPLQMRMDELGQLMVTVLDDGGATKAIARVRVRIKHDEKPLQRIPIIADLPLSELQVFTDSELKKLDEYRVFSVEDFIRVSRNSAGFKALEKRVSKTRTQKALKKAELLIIPDIPSHVSKELINNFSSVDEFVHKDSVSISKSLKKAKIDVGEQDVSEWQDKTRKYIGGRAL